MMTLLSDKLSSGLKYIRHPDYKIGLDMLNRWINDAKLQERNWKKRFTQMDKDNDYLLKENKAFKLERDNYLEELTEKRQEVVALRENLAVQYNYRKMLTKYYNAEIEKLLKGGE